MYNQITLIGRLGADPEIVTFDDEKRKARLRVATWRNVKDDTQESGWRQVTEWHNVTVWNDKSDRLRNTLKGDMVFVVGELRTREYEDEKGEKRTFKEIVGTVKKLPAGKHTPKGVGVIEENTEFEPGKSDASFPDIPQEFDDLSF